MFKKYLEYIKDNPEGYWFKAKWYGWGWTPVKWQGWAVTAVYIALIFLFALTIDENLPDRKIIFTFLLPIVFLTIALICIAYKKGEKPHWNWGDPKAKN
ncbi:hypothetical protein A3D55_02395 [Candidatus Jorgensenbacteria bacterium RIFCSPHIGHO2_02_FULL_45_20]|uniref:Uncharacterized protein n=2 Tax=Candidatus Joergenseniibacteriota TaxID=1752739 RepID=A0A1F6BPL6_9BACT|nr:MAG: hypothetical protein UX22_C0003G0018 [Candidatus Jorgensenbacteria bacterium GW2011_GWA2_45_9]OGG38702.1 MAG: hypothetical protein A3D55_02395 [Candidatus Jorgensenbacteria bacterium RIFCSPHIGHO2_02_FULL_45_20]